MKTNKLYPSQLDSKNKTNLLFDSSYDGPPRHSVICNTSSCLDHIEAVACNLQRCVCPSWDLIIRPLALSYDVNDYVCSKSKFI